MEKTKLFCIPYSGGMAGVYYKWKKELGSQYDLCPLETAGHGRRIKEAFYTDVAAAAEDLSQIIMENIGPETPYAIYGHSLGSLLAFETYFALKEKGAPEPKHIFFSGREAPDDQDEKTEYYKLPEKEFLAMVDVYGGNTNSVLSDKELLNVFVPILRSDFRLSETYEYVPHSSKIKCDFTVVNGTEDFSALTKDMTRWKAFAEGKCNFEHIKGNHFFITENVADTVAMIKRII